ncbi:MAG: hypothetical protein B7C24_05370 [Bacteroidetes bacterium 4572_77]|nr:MAG: hypothetical protein B7C24_05370 [Bacteroidetes bacterium 4572_77]
MKHQLAFILMLLTLSSLNTQAQYSMEITANYNLPQSSSFKSQFNKGIGASAEIHYFFNDSGLNASILFGLNSFSAKTAYKQEIKEENGPTEFEYEYQAHYYTFPLMLSLNYTFFQKEKYNFLVQFAFGSEYMERKIKQIGEFTSDTEKTKYLELGIYPSIGVSYEIMKDVSLLFKGGYNKTFGDENLSFIDIKAGVIYKI